MTCDAWTRLGCVVRSSGRLRWKDVMVSDQDSDDADGRRMEELSYADCMSRLATRQVGHLAVIVDDFPHVFPVNYRLDGDVVVFRTHLGSSLLAAHHASVGFQVEHLEVGTHSGWSVLVLGAAEDVTDRTDDPAAERSRHLGVAPWAPGVKPRIVRIVPGRVTGRRLTPEEFGFWSDDRGYI